MKYDPPQGYKSIYEYFGIINSKRKQARENYKSMPTDIYKQTSRYMFKKFNSMQNKKTDDYVDYGDDVDSKPASAPDMLVRTVSERQIRCFGSKTSSKYHKGFDSKRIIDDI